MAQNNIMIDSAYLIIDKMAQVGIAPLPRNYEVFYAALTGGNHKLQKEIFLLGKNPSQKEIDNVALQFFPERGSENASFKMTGTVGSELTKLGSTLDSEKQSLKAFNGAVEAARTSLIKVAEAGNATPEKLVGFIDAMINAVASRQEQGMTLTDRVVSTTDKMGDLLRENERLRMIANTDALSRLYNRRAFDERLAKSFDADTDLSNIALLIMDIDRFKSINDTHGHPIGDHVIKVVAEAISKLKAKGAFVARTGGEEFAIIIDANKSQHKMTTPILYQLAEHVRQSVDQMTVINPRTSEVLNNVTISVGACTGADAKNAMELYQKADEALFKAKENGRNQVVLYSTLGDIPAEDKRYPSLYRK